MNPSIALLIKQVISKTKETPLLFLCDGGPENDLHIRVDKWECEHLPVVDEKKRKYS